MSNDFVKSEFDKRLDTLNELVSEYFKEAGPVSVMEASALLQSLATLHQERQVFAQSLKMAEQAKKQSDGNQD